MEQQKNLERTDGLAESLGDLSLHHMDSPATELNDPLPDNALQSFTTETDEELQKEYDMISNDIIRELAELEGEDGPLNEGDLVNGVYFDKLELELNAIEQAMSQFEGRLDTLREQAQDLLLTLQKERTESILPSADGDAKLPNPTDSIREVPVVTADGQGDL